MKLFKIKKLFGKNDWPARSHSDVLATAHAGSATAAMAPSHPPTPRQTLQQPPPTWESCTHAVRRRNTEFKNACGSAANWTFQVNGPESG
uniref:Uncharacterized protein n=1 Tax=Xiphophorus maculatus TaxID=8083 RepID=A0A3B5PRI4_XIPMA